jgi:hypothetical protein
LEEIEIEIEIERERERERRNLESNGRNYISGYEGSQAVPASRSGKIIYTIGINLFCH